VNLVLLIPDGVGVRNFLIGSFLRQASEEGRCSILHFIPEDQLTTHYAQLTAEVNCGSLTPYDETPLSATLRYSLGYAHMHWADTRGMRHVRRQPVHGSWRTRAVHYAARLTGRVVASPQWIQVLDRWHRQLVDKSRTVQDYRRLFQQLKPSVIFCTHQRPPIILPPILAARALGIPTASFIFSWDNLTSKGRIAAPFDHYLVWSDHMRRELLCYYPDVAEDRVHVVGTPQFDPYADSNLIWRREEFFSRIGADPARPLVCYSGGDAGTCPEDHQHVGVLLALIRAKQIRGNPQVLLRPSPVDEGRRYDGVRREYPELIYARPAWVHSELSNWARVIPLPEDVQFLANLTHYADLNINTASTMTLDFAVHDKPIVNIAFDIASPPPLGVPLWDFYYQFEHYRPVVELGAARFARSPEELAEHVNAYLEDPSLDQNGRRRLVALGVGHPVGGSSQCIIEVLKKIARR